MRRPSLCCDQLALTSHGAGPVLVRLQARLAPGRITAVLGPNGAGKSTLMAALSGLLAPQAGSLCLDGQRLAEFRPEQLAQRLACLPQDTQVAFAFSAREVVEMGRYPHRQRPSAQEAKIVEACMDLTGVRWLAERELSSLSGGERARVQLARVLAQIWEPPADGGGRWLLLDEPTAALDLQHQHQVMGLLRRQARQQGLGVVVVLHDLNLALRYADDGLLLAGGGAAGRHGTIGEVLTAASIAKTWGVPGEMVRMRDGVSQYLAAEPRRTKNRLPGSAI